MLCSGYIVFSILRVGKLVKLDIDLTYSRDGQFVFTQKWEKVVKTSVNSSSHGAYIVQVDYNSLPEKNGKYI
jgi:hypothetical protein